MWYNEDIPFSELLGKTIKQVDVSTDKDEITFVTIEDETYRMYHSQDCCESVYVDDIVGDIKDLIGYPILLAEEATSNENPEGVNIEYQESFTWTYYKLATIKGYVDIKWYGASNGYYSESVSFVRI